MNGLHLFPLYTLWLSAKASFPPSLSPSHPKFTLYLHECVCLCVCICIFQQGLGLKMHINGAGLLSQLISKKCFKCSLENPYSQFLYISFLKVETTVNAMSERESWHASKWYPTFLEPI